MQPGMVVLSKCGRDKGRPLVVLSVQGEYILLADGDMRRLNKPKKKKVKHVQPTHTVFDLMSTAPRALCDADIRKWLSDFFILRREI